MNGITADMEFVEKDKLIRVRPGRVNEKGICPGAHCTNHQTESQNGNRIALLWQPHLFS